MSQQSTASQHTSAADEIFEKITLVSVDIGIWSAYKRTTEQDLMKMNAKLPETGIITKGGKKIYPSEKLNELGAIKKEVHRKLSSVGVSVFGGMARAMPDVQVAEIEAIIKDAEKRYRLLLDDCYNNYDSDLLAHHKSITDPVVREIVENSAITADEAMTRFHFHWDTFKITPQGGDTEGKTLVSNMTEKLYAEIAQGAKEAYEKSFLGKPRVGQKALHQIEALRNKLKGLAMLDGQNITAIEVMMEEVLSKLPQHGWIEGAELSSLLGLVFTMSDPERMLKHANKIEEVAQAALASQQATETEEEEVIEAEADVMESPAEEIVTAKAEAVEAAPEEVAQTIEPEPEAVVQAPVVTAPTKVASVVVAPAIAVPAAEKETLFIPPKVSVAVQRNAVPFF